MTNGGAKVWYFPDGFLPVKSSDGQMEAHEALMLFNTNATAAHILIDVYFSDRLPVRNIAVTVDPERIKTLRLDNPQDLSGLCIPPLTQYALRITSNINIVAQFGRLDTTQDNMAYYGCIGYHD
jgi:hypothetical protein